ncbi:MAG TPA: MoxR family ATPase [Dehalococcoidales bacterium]|nr:MoxR family ATPase [Dehalococcoidales bacterium]
MDKTQLAETRTQCANIVSGISDVFAGNKRWIVKILAAGLSGGHILFEDDPGSGRMQIAKVFARVCGLSFCRVHFTSDLSPADFLGSCELPAENSESGFMNNPFSTNILLANDINRAPPKTQTFLLEAIQERRAVTEGKTLVLPEPFIVIATQSLLERESLYPLTTAQLDCFSLKLSPGYAESLAEESEILAYLLAQQSNNPEKGISPVISADQFRKLQALVENEVYVDKSIMDYVSRIVRGTREHPQVEKGLSPAGAVAQLRVSRALALISGRDYVTPDDIKSLVTEVMAHRLVLKREDSRQNTKPEEILAEVVNAISIPVDSGPG